MRALSQHLCRQAKGEGILVEVNFPGLFRKAPISHYPPVNSRSPGSHRPKTEQDFVETRNVWLSDFCAVIEVNFPRASGPPTPTRRYGKLGAGVQWFLTRGVFDGVRRPGYNTLQAVAVRLTRSGQ